MSRFQVVEKEDIGVDWQVVRYNDVAYSRFDSEEEALTAAKKYVTDRNCNNALTAAEKRNAFEVYMDSDDGIYLGDLDGSEWFLTDRKGENVDRKHYELEGKAEVAVRPIPGT